MCLDSSSAYTRRYIYTHAHIRKKISLRDIISGVSARHVKLSVSPLMQERIRGHSVQPYTRSDRRELSHCVCLAHDDDTMRAAREKEEEEIPRCSERCLCVCAFALLRFFSFVAVERARFLGLLVCGVEALQQKTHTQKRVGNVIFFHRVGNCWELVPGR